MPICRLCNENKQQTDFQVDSRSKTGYTKLCKKCASRKANEWHHAHKTHHNQKMKEWRDKDKTINPNRYLWRIAKRRAKEYGRPFTITPSDIIVPEYCPVFGTKLEFTPGKYSPNAPSLDAINPKLGYIPGNIAVISHRANSIKQDATVEELMKVRDWLRKTIQKEPSSETGIEIS